MGKKPTFRKNTRNVSNFKMSIGVPIKVLHEAEGHIITCETITGEVYRGKLIEAEDNMNCQMTAGTGGASRGKSAILRAQAARGRGRAMPGGPGAPRGRGGFERGGGFGGRGRAG